MRWLRRRILSTMAKAVAVTYCFAVAFCAAVLGLVVDVGPTVVAPWAALAGQLIVVLLLGWAAATNPLNARYLRARAAHPRQLSVAEATSVPPGPANDDLAAHELVPLATVWDTTEAPHPLFDLFQTPRRSVTVVRNRHSSALTLLSRLDDGRILVTDTVATAPHRRLVVNVAAAGDLSVLLARHLEAIATMKEAGRSVEADDAGVFVEAQAIEHVAFHSLGPVLGPFFNPGAAAFPGRFLVGVSPGQLMELALDRSRTPVRATPVRVPAMT